MSPDLDLFGDPVQPPPGPDHKSPAQRLTERQHAEAVAGLNPLRHTRGPEGVTCGACRFRVLYRHHDRTYPKCEAPGAPISHGPATDIRKWWPACAAFDPKGDPMSESTQPTYPSGDEVRLGDIVSRGRSPKRYAVDEVPHTQEGLIGLTPLEGYTHASAMADALVLQERRP